MNTWLKIKDLFIAGWDTVRNTTAGAWNAIKDTFAGAWNQIKHLTSVGIESVRHFFTSGWHEIGQKMIQGIVDGIRGGWNWVVDSARGVAQAALDAAKSALGIASPSKAFEDIGRNISAGMSKGISETMQMPELSIKNMVRHSVQAVQPAGVAPTASSSGRLDIFLHGESSLPGDRVKLRELARALQQELVLSGGRVAVA